MTAIKAVLFDMDGVLIDAKDWHFQALNRALELFVAPIPYDEHLATFDGLPTKRKLEILGHARRLPKGLYPFINALKQKYTMEIIHASCRPRFDHRYALSRLRREGYRLAVCSNSVRRTVEAMMELSGLDEHLEVTLSNEDVAHPKPHPEIYATAIARLGLAPAECLIVEDNDHGVQAARASGAHVHVVSTVDQVGYAEIKAAILAAEGVRS